MAPPRYPYDLTHFSAITSKIGRLTGVTCVPVVAGDSHELEITAVVRQAPLRRQLSVDARVDLFGFFVPYWQIYGRETWQSFIEQGVDETVTLPTVNVTQGQLSYHGCGTRISGTVPKWIIEGYNRIWRRWFRVPNVTPENSLAEDYVPVANDDRNYGLKTAMLPSYLTPFDDQSDLNATDRVLASASNFDLVNLARLKARFKTEIQRNWFDQRYADIMKNQFSGAMISAENEERPELLFREMNWMSGYDVNGTTEGSLGTYVGKSEAVVNARMPRKFFAEHGTMWILAVMRFPTIVTRHNHFLVNHPDPSYKEISGDPEIYAAEDPIELVHSDFNQQSASGVQMGKYPYGQWYRTHPSHVHEDYFDQEGYPFLDSDDLDGASLDERTYVDHDKYKDVFKDQSLGHYTVVSKIGLQSQRIIPPARSSMLAGTK